jgi:hypothetical protein
MIKSGVNPVKKDHRDYSFHRTFGALTPTFTDALNLDAGLTMPDQDADGLPYGCTGYASDDLCTDEDKIIYYPKSTYDQTLMMEGITPSDPNFEKVGCDVRDSLNSTIVYGLQAVGETGSQALNHRRGAYYNVDLAQGMDWFDSLRNCLVLNQRSISIATPWYPTWETTNQGIIKAPNSYDTTFASWHNWKVCGWKTINGVVYLIGKSWQGKSYGDGGLCYFPREVINQLMTIQGTGAFTLTPYTNQMAQRVILTLWEYVGSYLRLIANKIVS